jgi:hypothetical protein
VIVSGGKTVTTQHFVARAWRPSVDHLYSLYDALVSINVPNDRARAVVDAMERDMLSELVTKTEFKAELQLLRHEMATMRDLLSKDIQHLSTVMTVRLGSLIGAGFVLLYALQRFG